MINEIKYIGKSIEDILIPSKSEYNRYDSKFWRIVTNKPEYQSPFSNARYNLGLKFIFGEIIKKTFFSFIFLGNDFPNTSNKEILLIIQKYKFAKIYIPKQNGIECRYFKRGVLFYFDYNVDNKINRLFKLIKLNSSTLLSDDHV